MVIEVLGKPYRVGARGPDEFDCWGLVVYLYREAYKITLAEIPTPELLPTRTLAETAEEEMDAGDWTEVTEPQDGDVVALSRSKIIHHVGVWCSKYCFHTLDGRPVAGDTIGALTAYRFITIRFFRHGQNIHLQ